MPWGKIDDRAWRHDRFDGVGPSSYALYWAAISYSNEKLLDGHLKNHHIAQVCGYRVIAPQAADRLIESGLWIVEDGGIYIHDYDQYNPLKAQVLKRRADGAERQARWLAAQKADQESDDITKENVTNTVTNSVRDTHHNSVSDETIPGTPVPSSGDPVSQSKLSADNLAASAAVLSLHDVREDLLRRCSATAKKAAIVGEAFVYCFRGGTKPVFGRLSHLSTEAGGANKLITLMFEASPHWDEYGDPHDYLTRVVQNAAKRSKANGHARTDANVVHATVKASDIPVNPEWAKAHDDDEQTARVANRERWKQSYVKPGERPGV